MELGNMMFGNSRGSFPIERSVGWEIELDRLFNAYSPEPDHYGPRFENEIFMVLPYYWGECTCGFEERWARADAEWNTVNVHTPDCYQTELHSRMAEYDGSSGYATIDAQVHGSGSDIFFGFYVDSEPLKIGGRSVGQSITMSPRDDEPMEAWRKAYDARQKFENKLMTELCQKHKQDRKYSAAVHCTCDYKAKRAEWCATDDHAKDCPIVLPNFRYKPTGFEIQWYKYPLRDSYKNQSVGLGDFRKIIDTCIGSIGTQVSATASALSTA